MYNQQAPPGWQPYPGPYAAPGAAYTYGGSAYSPQAGPSGDPYKPAAYGAGAGAPYAGAGAPYAGAPYGSTSYGAPPYGSSPYVAPPGAVAIGMPSAPPPYGGDDQFAADLARANAAIRNAFVRKVFGIVFIQLLVTIGVSCVCLFCDPVRLYVQNYRWPFYLAWGLSFGLVLVLSCFESVRRHYPMNLVTLAAFTVCEAFLVGMISSYWGTNIVLMAFIATAAAVFAITVFAFNTKVDVTSWGSALLVLGIVFIVMLIIGIFWRQKIYQLIIAGIGALLFSVYLLYDLQLLMGGKRYSIGVDEYILAALSIYLDIINLFLMILYIFGLADSN